MDVIGLWEVVSGQIFDTKNMEMVWVPKEVALASEEIDDDFKKIYTALFEFKENGSLCMMMKGPAADSVPKDELDAAVEAGEVFVEDGFVFIPQTFEWKADGENILINTKEEGEVFGEKIDPWKAAVIEGNTMIVLESYQICKIGETPSSVRKKEVKTLSDEEKAAVGVYKGLYTKMVCDENKNEEEFTLELKEDGTGLSHRNNLDIKVPEWSVEGGKVKLTEKFLGKIDYTGTLEGGKLSLFNGDPSAPMTYEYVYEKQ